MGDAIDELQNSTRKVLGPVYRGQYLDDAVIQQKYYQPFLSASQQGDDLLAEVIENSFISTSKDPLVADDFIGFNLDANYNESYSAVEFIIISKTGVDIDDISYYGANFCSGNTNCNMIQQEVLLKNGLSFNILNASFEIIERQNLPNYKLYSIFLEEK